MKNQFSIENFFNNLPEYLLYLFVFLLPWQTRWIFKDAFIKNTVFEYGRMSLYAFDIVLLLLLIILLFSIVRRNTNKLINFKIKRLNIVFLFFCFFVFLSVLWSSDKLISFYWATRILLGFGLLWAVQKINFSKVKLAITIVSAAAIQGVLALWQFFTQSIWESKWLGLAGQSARDLGTSVVEFGLERWLRAYGSLPHPNILGGMLVLSLIALIYLLPKVRYHYQKIFIISSFTFIIAGIFFSFSRSAWIGLGLVYVCLGYIIIKNKYWDIKRPHTAIFIYGLLLLVLFSFTSLPLVKTRLNLGPAQRLELQSNSMRIESIKEAVKIYQDNWLLGTGIGNYTLALHQKYPDLDTWLLQPPHNTYLLVLAELGAIGIMIFILLCYCIAEFAKKLSCLRPKRGVNQEVNKSTIVFLFSCFFVLLTFDHYFWTLASGLYPLFLALSLHIKNIN